MLSARELATVLAALDNWSAEDYYYEPGAELPVNAGRFTEHEPLTLDEINALRKRLNCGHSSREVVVVWEHEYSDPRIESYNFDSEAEEVAFLQGIQDCDPTGEWYHVCDSEEEAEQYLRDSGRTDALAHDEEG